MSNIEIKMALTVRQLRHEELAWANARYGEIDFLPSASDHYIALAEVGGKPAGLGRVVRLSHHRAELGGLYVFDAFRGCGVSGAIISHLISQADVARLYCLPFSHLRAVYEKAGFMLAPDAALAPAQVRDKHAWCNRHYPDPVLLMYRDAATGMG